MRKVFFSFHHKNDIFRTNEVRNIGTIEGNKPVISNDWEKIEKSDAKIKNWIDDQLSGRSCVIVLIGENTAGRKWINYEIKKAWDDQKGLFGIYIHNLKGINGKQSKKGDNPFESFTIGKGDNAADVVKAYDPPCSTSKDVYAYIKENLAKWVESAIEMRKQT